MRLQFENYIYMADLCHKSVAKSGTSLQLSHSSDTRALMQIHWMHKKNFQFSSHLSLSLFMLEIKDISR